jgi:hypothetical protein
LHIRCRETASGVGEIIDAWICSRENDVDTSGHEDGHDGARQLTAKDSFGGRSEKMGRFEIADHISGYVTNECLRAALSMSTDLAQQHLGVAFKQQWLRKS